MDAGLDSLCTAVHVTADDLLPSVAANARRAIDDAAVVALAVAQGAWASFEPTLPGRRPGAPGPPVSAAAQPAGYFKRRRALRESIDWLAGVFAGRSPSADKLGRQFPAVEQMLREGQADITAFVRAAAGNRQRHPGELVTRL